MKKRIKIVSDGTAVGTVVTDLETGADLSPVVRSVEFAVEAGGVAGVKLVLSPLAVDVKVVGELIAATNRTEPASDPVAGA